MNEEQTNWPLPPLAAAGLLITLLGLGGVVAGAFEMFERPWAYGMGLLGIFGGIVMYYFFAWVID